MITSGSALTDIAQDNGNDIMLRKYIGSVGHYHNCTLFQVQCTTILSFVTVIKIMTTYTGMVMLCYVQLYHGCDLPIPPCFFLRGSLNHVKMFIKDN